MDIRDLKNIDNKHMPSIIWDWCAKPTAEEIDSKLNSFSDMGIKRVFVRPTASLVIPYLSDSYFELVRTCARRSAKHGIELWLFDENSNSSGRGGSEITSVSEYSLREFTPAKENDRFSDDTALSETIVLRDKSRHYNREYSSFPDICDDFVTQCFTEAVYDKYIMQCKRFIGYEIKGFVSQIDLPENSVFFSQIAFDKVSRSENLLNLAENLLSTEPFDKALKNAYLNQISFLSSSNFTAKIKDKCNKNNLMLSFGTSGANYISRQCMYMLSDMPFVATSDNFNFTEIKLLTSVCEQFNKPSLALLKTKAFSSCGERYMAAMALISMGINEIAYDSIAFSLSDSRKHGKYACVLSPLSELDISRRISRLLNVVNETKTDADVLLIYPSSSLNILHSNDISKEKELYNSFNEKVSSLIKKGVTFHIADEYMLLNHGAFTNDSIRIGDYEYKTLVIPDAPYFSSDVINIIENFKDNCALLSQSTIFPELEVFVPFENKDFSVLCDNELYINYRKDEENSYALISALECDSLIKACSKTNKEIFFADISSGEVYKLSEDGFILPKGQTVTLIASNSISADTAPPIFDNIITKEYEKHCDAQFFLSSADENIYSLKTANVCLGKKSYINTDIDTLHKEFYSLSEGETVKVKYQFFVQSGNIENVSMYLENTEGIENASINGKPLVAFEPSSKDKHFSGCDISSYIAQGKNTISLEYKKYNIYSPVHSTPSHSYSYTYTPTSLEGVYLVGDFDINDGMLCETSSYGSDVCASGMPNYYGELTYLCKLPDDTLRNKILSVKGNFDICRIKIGKREETFFSPSPVMELFDLDSLGVAEITIINTPYNLFKSACEPTKSFGIEEIYIAKEKEDA